MINALTELDADLKANGKEFKDIIAAYIEYRPTFDDEDNKPFTLYPDWTNEECKAFCDFMNFEYDDGYGTQHLFGTIWLGNNTWFERHEYDGSEHWVYQECPELPSRIATALGEV